MLCLGSLGVWLFFFVLGNHSLGLQLSGEVDVIGVMNAESGTAAIVAGLDALLLAAVAIGLFCVVAIIFVATTYDSASIPWRQPPRPS